MVSKLISAVALLAFAGWASAADCECNKEWIGCLDRKEKERQEKMDAALEECNKILPDYLVAVQSCAPKPDMEALKPTEEEMEKRNAYRVCNMEGCKLPPFAGPPPPVGPVTPMRAKRQALPAGPRPIRPQRPFGGFGQQHQVPLLHRALQAAWSTPDARAFHKCNSDVFREFSAPQLGAFGGPTPDQMDILSQCAEELGCDKYQPKWADYADGQQNLCYQSVNEHFYPQGEPQPVKRQVIGGQQQVREPSEEMKANAAQMFETCECQKNALQAAFEAGVEGLVDVAEHECMTAEEHIAEWTRPMPHPWGGFVSEPAGGRPRPQGGPQGRVPGPRFPGPLQSDDNEVDF